MSKAYSGELKAEIVIKSLREEQTTRELSREYGIDSSLINRWRREAFEHLKNGFNKEFPQEKVIEKSEEKIAKLERKVGQLMMDNDFLKKNYIKHCMKRG